MATKRNGGSSGSGKFLLGLLFGIASVALGGWAYLRFGNLPVAVTDHAWAYEHQLTHTALDARIDREKKPAPFGTGEDVFESGAHVYREQCASCHGVPGKPVPFAKDMYPDAPQLWVKHKNSAVVGVSDDDTGETYWKVANGIRLTGMPSFQHILTDTQMWQVSLLLKNADQPLPDPVSRILTAPTQ
jgi:thiosulfate dehydrogenase